MEEAEAEMEEAVVYEHSCRLTAEPEPMPGGVLAMRLVTVTRWRAPTSHKRPREMLRWPTGTLNSRMSRTTIFPGGSS